MADITMCEGKECRLKETCYRYLASVNPYRQTFFTEVPYDKEINKCEYYWEFYKPNYEPGKPE
jgi:hypothetical protein